MSEIHTYRSANNLVEIEVLFEGDTVWLTKGQMAEILQIPPREINACLSYIFIDGALGGERYGMLYGYAAVGDSNHPVSLFNLDALVLVANLVTDTVRISHFHRWADSRLEIFPMPPATRNARARMEKLRRLEQAFRNVHLRTLVETTEKQMVSDPLITKGCELLRNVVSHQASTLLN